MQATRLIDHVTEILFKSKTTHEFLSERNGRNRVALFISKIRFRTTIERVVFSDCSRFWNSQSFPQQQSKYSTSPPNRFHYHPTWPAATRVFLPPTNGGSGERARNEVEKVAAQDHYVIEGFPTTMTDGAVGDFNKSNTIRGLNRSCLVVASCCATDWSGDFASMVMSESTRIACFIVASSAIWRKI